MRRKPTPQPLNLADINKANSDKRSQLVTTFARSASSGHSSQRSAPLPTRPLTGKSPRLPPLNFDQRHPHTARDRTDSTPPLPSSTFDHGQGPKYNTGSAPNESSPTSQSSHTTVGYRANTSDPLRANLPTPYSSRQGSNLSIPSRSELSLSSADDYDNAPPISPVKKGRSKTFGLLSRHKSVRDKDQRVPKSIPTSYPSTPRLPTSYGTSAPLKTAPVAQERSFGDMMNSSIRNRSEDRSQSRDGVGSRDKIHPTSLKESGTSNFFSGLKSGSTIFSKGLFGKSSRSGSTTEREPTVDDEHYVLKVINLPLVEQTRRTRISKRLETSRDKTEFWMPAFPWRAIDYLNFKGCEVEGLYRVPGSGPQIKKWQRRFDEEYDVDLFEADDLYDINIIGSMLKAWLRELPDELFPKEAQERIARECAGAEEVPQMLIDELSNLSPFNYYLLFAITCHLSLLLAHSDKNKMDFRNLCICFQPCMKIDAFSFKFLVCDWRSCWQGCKSETKYIEEEYKLFDLPPPRGVSEPQQPAQKEAKTDRSHLHSHGEQTNGSATEQHQDNQYATRSESNAVQTSKALSIDTDVSDTNADTEQNRHANRMQLRRLSPIKPLSPIGF